MAHGRERVHLDIVEAAHLRRHAEAFGGSGRIHSQIFGIAGLGSVEDMDRLRSTRGWSACGILTGDEARVEAGHEAGEPGALFAVEGSILRDMRDHHRRGLRLWLLQGHQRP
ncbi:hypothetical protein D3C71_543100 [compost metagenome]